MEQKRNENENELIQVRLDINIEEDNTATATSADDNSDNSTDNDTDTPTSDELAAAASTPILCTITRAADTAKKAHTARRDDISARASKAAWNVVDGINRLAAAPTARNKERLTAAIATALHVVGVAAQEGITARSRGYNVDYTPTYLTGILVMAARAILTAHDDGRQEDETYLTLLYTDVQTAVEAATDNVPIRRKPAAALAVAVGALIEAVCNI